MTTIELDGVTVDRDGSRLLDGIDLTVEAGSVLAVVGPTGSGKTTLLRAIAGLDTVDAGSVRFDGVDVTRRPTRERDVAFAFQRPVLFPDRTAGRNIAMPLELDRRAADQIRERVGAEARALHIDGLLGARPDELSAGQARVVQIARALVGQPRAMLLDEPFTGLDPAWKATILRELALIQRGFGVTTVAALTDAGDAFAMAGRVAVLEAGTVVQTGSPTEVCDRPRTVGAGLLTGAADVLTVEVEVDPVGAWLVAPGLRVRAWQPLVRERAGRRLQLIVRPHWWDVDAPGATVDAVVERVVAIGGSPTAVCRIGRHRVTIALDRERARRTTPGERVRLRLAHVHLIDPLTGSALT